MSDTQTVLLLHGPRQPYQIAKEHPIPSLQNDFEVLVRVKAIGLNPIDWKAPDFNFGIPQLPYISGRELSGEVVSVGSRSSKWKQNDKVVAISTDYRDLRKAAYQQYVVASEYNLVRLPPKWSHNHGSTIGVAFVASALALGLSLGLDFSSVLGGPDLYSIVRNISPELIPGDVRAETLGNIRENERLKRGDWLAVWGGSATSANLAIQLAKLVGVKVAVLVDQAKHGLWLSNDPILRPDLLVDSHDPERAVSVVLANTKGRLRHGLDTRGKDTAGHLLRILLPQTDSTESAYHTLPTPPGTPGKEDGRVHLVGMTGLPKEFPQDKAVLHSVPIKLFHDVPANRIFVSSMAPAVVGGDTAIRQSEKTPDTTTKAVQLPASGDSEPLRASNGINGNHFIPNYPVPRVSLVDRFIDEPRQLNVAVIEGGLAGITSGILLPKKVPGIQLTIYEKNHDFGGTWLENVYPGVRCDIPSHVYQSTFAPNINWSDEFASGTEIRDYWQGLARQYDVYQYAQFGRKVDGLEWDADDGSWVLTVKNTATNEVSKDRAHFVISAVGRFNAWQLPDYPGLPDYKGVLRHASDWSSDFDPKDKRVAVIGNGASGIQLVANIQKAVGRLDHYVRGRTWIATSWAGDDRTLEPQPISEEKKSTFEDPKQYLAFRKELEAKYWRRFGTFFRNSEANEELRQRFIEVMTKRLAKKPHLIDSIIPDFSPNCRRLTPGPGYLEAVAEDNVDYITTPIRRFTEKGIETDDGVEREVDAIFCATGANRDMVPQFPIVASGQDLRDLWKQDGDHGFPYTYLGVATPGFPNLFHLHGPHGTGPSGTVPYSVESQITHFAKILRKASREGIKSMEPTAKATEDFIEYSDAFFTSTVLSDGCSSWYNGGNPGGRIHGVWPGSAVHLALVRRDPRWEDWDYQYLSETGNRFLWYFGNGWSRLEGDPEADLTKYLKEPDQIDLRDVHESWWAFP
ncbi:flavin-binding monooxygenase [Paramyrothecium foliicola]|nr:flavin-binding monooxygenase [Paramyrothecium foliicola]